jgi:hypothetical protein
MPFFFTLKYQILALLLIIGLLLPFLLQMSMRVVEKLKVGSRTKNPPLEFYFQTLINLQNHHQEISITFLFIIIIINNVMLQTFGTILGHLPSHL